MPYCSSCGNELEGGEEFCPSCGEKVNVERSSDEEPEIHHKAESTGISVLSGESVKLNRHPNWAAWTGSFLGAFIFIGIGILIGTPSSTTFGLLVGTPFLLRAYLGHKKSRYVVTDKRVIKKTGITAENTEEIRLEDINSLKTKNFGQDISISTTTAGGDLRLRLPPNPQEFANVIRQLQDQ